MAKLTFSSLISSRFKLPEKEIDVPANTLEELFERLEDNANGLKEFIFIERGVVNPFCAIFLNNKKIEGDCLNITLNKNDNIMILNMIAGG